MERGCAIFGTPSLELQVVATMRVATLVFQIHWDTELLNSNLPEFLCLNSMETSFTLGVPLLGFPCIEQRGALIARVS